MCSIIYLIGHSDRDTPHYLTKLVQVSKLGHMDNLTSAQVAERLGVSVKTVHRMVLAEDLRPAAKLPGRTGAYLFDPADIETLARRTAA